MSNTRYLKYLPRFSVIKINFPSPGYYLKKFMSSQITGYTALHRAASWGHPDCLKVLVTNGADLQIRNVHGERAREAAARYRKDSCVDYLDRAGTRRLRNPEFMC